MTSAPTIRRLSAFRPDVQRALELLIRQAAGASRRERYDLYAQAKRQLSLLCGWDAPPHRRDDDLYNRAISKFVKGVRL